jgi:hypothetical protein
MTDILIPMDDLNKKGLSINEYLILYNLVNNQCISLMFDHTDKQIVRLEMKGYVKVLNQEVCIREKTVKMFGTDKDLFLTWLEIYPVRVKKTRSPGSRALSPKDANTMLGKRLRNKWSLIFKKDIKAQEEAIKVLELQLKDMKKSGDLEFMVEAARWLNEGYHEKYAYLLEESLEENVYENEDYM